MRGSGQDWARCLSYTPRSWFRSVCYDLVHRGVLSEVVLMPVYYRYNAAKTRIRNVSLKSLLTEPFLQTEPPLSRRVTVTDVRTMGFEKVGVRFRLPPQKRGTQLCTYLLSFNGTTIVVVIFSMDYVHLPPEKERPRPQTFHGCQDSLPRGGRSSLLFRASGNQKLDLLDSP